ncbi:hypothetical protein PB2503_10884 [Parvularcula bermudensis HTCC2503]|uniref:Methyltransferase type 11 domain-containing protein n=1 Tax=Parvularcula bermudensis (strain ATCC BAA-594 / HTCC2503 / KCTC 12087) TaxID=314260 RepID=E0THT1_PARBH|nr:class I SAM-dependent methyltransferase [Parvularcula bermudensis]ADM10224.1 hypothetical protein PB2503_10884 [Parvularcula bermudensis HTCC2503]
MRSYLLPSLLLLTVAACGGEPENVGGTDLGPSEVNENRAASEDRTTSSGLTLTAAIDHPARDPDDRARDRFRHPVETLEFFTVVPDTTIMEIWPGGGWYSDILVPYISENGGTYIAALSAAGDRAEKAEAFRNDYPDHTVEVTVFGKDTGPLATASSVDQILTFRNAHNWVDGGYAEKAFADFFDALKPGGTLGLVDHRLPSEADPAQEQGTGYLKEETVIDLAEAAGFTLIARSNINANPLDTADHPFGVWTLPPVSRTEARDGSVPEGFDPQIYLAIGESDRMTILFAKPITADGPLLE